MKTRLEGFPHIFYISCYQDKERREKLIENFKTRNLSYSKIEAIDGRKEDISKYLVGGIPPNMNNAEIACTLSHLKAINYFYHHMPDCDGIVICEDDLDFSPVEYWNFSWKELFDNLPYDLEILQMSIINDIQISANIHPRYNNDFGTGIYYITKDYARRLLEFHCTSNKYNINRGTKPRSVSDDLIYLPARAYAIPLFLYDISFESTIHQDHVKIFHQKSYDAILNFWKTQGKSIPLNTLLQYDPRMGRLPLPLPN